MKPIDYKQYDTRWASANYSAKGESKTIKSSGCGVTCASMVIASLKDSSVTPKTCADWSMANGYKALNQGTFYTYFVPQLKQYGIECKRLNTSNLYKQPSASVHKQVASELKKGNWIIACMGVGTWTKGGHYVLCYDYDGTNVYINDPASESQNRAVNKLSVWQNEVKYYWVVTVPEQSKVTTTPSTTSTNSSVKDVQAYLNSSYGFKLSLDGIYGKNTRKELIRALQSEIGASADGVFGVKTKSLCKTIKKGSEGDLVKIWQCYLVCRGYNLKIDGDFGSITEKHTIALQNAYKLVQDGIVGENTWYILR